jgi:hypothetical protein
MESCTCRYEPLLIASRDTRPRYVQIHRLQFAHDESIGRGTVESPTSLVKGFALAGAAYVSGTMVNGDEIVTSQHFFLQSP